MVSVPLGAENVRDRREVAQPSPATFEIIESRLAQVGSLSVRRALPRRGRRTIGPWCLADHSGPERVTTNSDLGVGPHPHLGLQTVTWLLDGELLHRDSLGCEQMIRPGQLNLMTAGRGVSHVEEVSDGYRGQLHGMQLWVAQPESTRHDGAAFEHYDDLPRVDLAGGSATVLIGSLAGVTSPARRDSDLLGVDLDVRGPTCVVPLRAEHEYGLIVLSGSIEFERQLLEIGHLGYLGTAREQCELVVRSPARVLLLGGEPFVEPILMWWNFVARTREEMVAAYRHWSSDAGWFGRVNSNRARIPVGPPPWLGTAATAGGHTTP